MVEIVNKSRDFSEVEIYLMTISPAIISMKDVSDGEKIKVDGYVIFNDINDKGEETEIMSIITPDKKVYCFQSATFKRSFMDIYNIMHGKEFCIVKTSGETKAGRPYINCWLDI